MLVTLNDGAMVSVYNTETKNTLSKTLSEHAMRFHVVDRQTNTARQHIATTDKKLINEIMGVVARRYGRLDASNSWVKIRLSTKEFWPADNYRRILQEDLERFFGKNAIVTGTSIRYIYYTSDDRMPEHSPDNIGTKFGYPLIYEGYAVASIFKISGYDVLSPGSNVVYWLNEPMWNGFHSNKRRVPKEFPGTTGFVATKWCQRTGYATYNQDGIDIAAMTQGKSVAIWALNDLRDYWRARQGRDIFDNIGETFNVEAKNGKNKPSAKEEFLKLLEIKTNAPFGLVGATCPKCGELLNSPYGKCLKCKAKIHYGYDGEIADSYCTHCGKQHGLCDVAQHDMTKGEHKRQHLFLHGKWFGG